MIDDDSRYSPQVRTTITESTDTFACKRRVKAISVVFCYEEFADVHVSLDVDSPCWRCEQGARRRLAYAYSMDPEDVTSEDAIAMLRQAVNTKSHGTTNLLILKALKNKPRTVKELASLAGVTPVAIRAALSRMREDNLATKAGPIWSATKKGLRTASTGRS